MIDDKKREENSYLPRSYGKGPGRKPRRRNRSLDNSKRHPLTDTKTVNQAPSDGPVETGPIHVSDLEPKSSLSQVDKSDIVEADAAVMDEPVEETDTLEPSLQPCHVLEDTAINDLSFTVAEIVDDKSLSVHVKLAGIRFGYACKVYHFDSGDMDVNYGEWVVVKTEKGLGLGQVAIPPFEREIDSAQAESLRRIIRKGTKVDIDQRERCCQRESEAYSYCIDRIDQLQLPMKLVSVECFFDCSKYVFYFTSEGRVDFRELVKSLVGRFPVRIEMRQIGVRHEAKMTGGIACCGQELCCSRFLTDFRPVSVKMAKNQNLSLNPTKISGVCGRLMCCLSYEHEVYEEFIKSLPKVGKLVSTTKGEGFVVKHNPLEETVLLRLPDDSIIEVRSIDILAELDVDVIKKKASPNQPQVKPQKKTQGRKPQSVSANDEN
jgi:cell fate regulator YaaT (PSP1 superfamily)